MEDPRGAHAPRLRPEPRERARDAPHGAGRDPTRAGPGGAIPAARS